MLSNNPDEAAAHQLERLLILPKLAHWRNASFRRLSVEAVDCTLANRQPASAADLAALTFDHLRDIARKIRDGHTDDYQQYWSYDQSNKALSKSKPENDCRDALLSDLKERLGKFDIDAQREVSVADNKRPDIWVSFGGTNGFNISIETKKDSNDELWRSIHEQLIRKYTRDPGTDGHGIYLVFWFGGKGMPLPNDGGKKNSHRPGTGRSSAANTLTGRKLPHSDLRDRLCVAANAIRNKKVITVTTAQSARQTHKTFRNPRISSCR